MKFKTVFSFALILFIIVAAAVYLVALDNRYKQIAGKDYFDIRTLRMIKADPSASGEVVVQYPLLNSSYTIDNSADSSSEK
ncbi:MAG: hypothetical protein PHP89_05670 [Candidatus Omnitrophica bacterium]|jgi:hypothetical protein|nr:hypothetical protein [Candidatus Omnitrophota bacterium]